MFPLREVQVSSPYLKPSRLGDVLAALQTMAVHPEYRAACDTWAYKISGDKGKADYWRNVLEEHPEFFRRSLAYEDHYALILRRAQPGRFHFGKHKPLTDEDYKALDPGEAKKVSRPPLSESQIKMLTDIAINLHGKAVEASRDWRWWVAPSLSFGGSFGGAILGFLAATWFKKVC